jgi:predicted transcriptional regulator
MNSENNILKIIWHKGSGAHTNAIAREAGFGVDYTRYILNQLVKDTLVTPASSRNLFRVTFKGRRRLEIMGVIESSIAEPATPMTEPKVMTVAAMAERKEEKPAEEHVSAKKEPVEKKRTKKHPPSKNVIKVKQADVKKKSTHKKIQPIQKKHAAKKYPIAQEVLIQEVQEAIPAKPQEPPRVVLAHNLTSNSEEKKLNVWGAIKKAAKYLSEIAPGEKN